MVCGGQAAAVLHSGSCSQESRFLAGARDGRSGALRPGHPVTFDEVGDLITSVHLEGIYAGQGFDSPHHLLTGVKIIKGDQTKPYRDGHAWLNAEHSGFPDGIKHGARVRFWASYFSRKCGQRLTEVREVEIIEEAKEE